MISDFDSEDEAWGMDYDAVDRSLAAPRMGQRAKIRTRKILRDSRKKESSFDKHRVVPHGAQNYGGAALWKK